MGKQALPENILNEIFDIFWPRLLASLEPVESPASRLEEIPTSMEPEKYLSPAEFIALLKAAKDDRERCIILMLGGVGLRITEMTKIKIEDVDLEKGFMYIPAENTKFGKARIVVLLPEVQEALVKQIAGRSKDWLFPSYKKNHIGSEQVTHLLGEIAIRSRLQEVTRKDKAGKSWHRIRPHVLRHSFARWCLECRVPAGVLRDQLGLYSPTTAGVHLKNSLNHRREAYMRSGLSDVLAGRKLES